MEMVIVGLDNGLCIKRNEYTNNIPELKRFEDAWDKDNEFDFEICYFRKCYNVRHMIIESIKVAYDNDISEPLTVEHIEKIIKGLQAFNADNWQDNGGSIWDWDDEEYPYSAKIQSDIENLLYLKELMGRYNLEVYFYDSY